MFLHICFVSLCVLWKGVFAEKSKYRGNRRIYKKTAKTAVL